MNPFLLLKDRFDFEQKSGFVIAHRNFRLRDVVYDIGFKHQSEGYKGDENFYTIPVSDYSDKDLAELKIMLGDLIAPNRSLVCVSTNGDNSGEKLLLIERKPEGLESVEYCTADTAQLSKKEPGLTERLRTIEQEFTQAACSE